MIHSDECFTLSYPEARTFFSAIRTKRRKIERSMARKVSDDPRLIPERARYRKTVLLEDRVWEHMEAHPDFDPDDWAPDES